MRPFMDSSSIYLSLPFLILKQHHPYGQTYVLYYMTSTSFLEKERNERCYTCLTMFMISYPYWMATAVLVLESKSELQCLLSFISITSSTGSLFCKSTHSQVQRLINSLAHFMMRTHVAVVVDRRHLQSNLMFIVTSGRFELTPDKACNLFFCLRWF